MMAQATIKRNAVELYQHIFEHLPDALIVVDQSGQIVRANTRAERMFGYEPGELTGVTVEALIPERLAGRHPSLRVDYMAAPHSRPMGAGRVFPVRRKDGGALSVQVMLTPLTTDEGLMVCCTLRDIAAPGRETELWAVLASLVESATDAIVGENLGGTILSWNRAAEAVFGYSAAEAIGQPGTMLIPPGYEDEEARILASLRRGEAVELYETARCHKDGRLMDVWVRASPVRDPGGRVAGGAVTTRDITGRKREEAAMRENEERFRSAFSFAAIGMALVALDGRWLRVNEALCCILGYAETELLSCTFQDLTHPEDLESDLNLVQQILAGAITYYHLEKRYVRKDGRVVWALLSVSLVRDDLGEPLYFIAQIQDISSRKEAEQRLAEASRSREETLALLNTLIASAPTGLAFVSADYRFIHCNEALAELNGIPAADHTGQLVADVVPDLWPQLRPIYDRVMAGEGPIVNLEIGGATAAMPGKPRYWLGSYYPVQIQDEIIGIGVMITEVTEQKRLEEQLRQSQKMQAIGQLAGGVAHDFNNLLTVINGYSDLLQLDLSILADPSHPALDAVNAIRDAGERAALLTRQLLQLSRESATEITVLDVSEVLERIARMLRRLIGEDIALVTVAPAGLRQVMADHSQIEQIILNLSLNGRDAMPGGGQLIIEVRDVVLEGAIYSSPNYRPGPYVQLTVSDTGTGMTQQIMERIFEPFFTTKSPGKGTGLGLATVYGIVEQLGGFIAVYSEPGVGTTFNIFLPALEASAPRPAPDADTGRDLSGSETIMLVEDEDGVRRLARLALETQGYVVIEARGGPEAIRLSAGLQRPVDLLITDVVMPEMSGRQLAEALRAEQRQLRVLFTSGYTGETISRHGITEAGDGFLQKPFTPISLAKSVREALDR